jgi:hypothetical protein
MLVLIAKSRRLAICVGEGMCGKQLRYLVK